MKRLKCYLNGVFVVLSWAEAYQKLWEVAFGWVAAADWCRYHLRECEGARTLSPDVTRSTKEFLLLVLTRKIPLSRTEFVARFPKLEETKNNTFSQRAHRVKDIFTRETEVRHPLLEHVPLVFITGTSEPA